MECPRCHKEFATLKWEEGKPVSANGIKVIEGNKKFKPNETLACTSCGYEYTNWDVMLALAKGCEGQGSNDGKNKEVHV